MAATLIRARSDRRDVRRWLFSLLIVATTGCVTALTWNLLRANGLDAFEYPILALSTVLAIPIVTSFWLAVAGFLAEWHGRVPAPVASPSTPLAIRTAIVMPIHNEDPARVVAALRATYESVAATGELGAFRFFVLSDTTDPHRWLDEEVAIDGLRSALHAQDRLVYRHRTTNTDRKVGNIADFCRRWGPQFECMVVLDADSVMSGDTIVHLARLMQTHPGIGILQVPPVPVNGSSLWARGQQFAASAYGRTWAAGLAWLQAAQGNYYGHNAILRIRAFVENCELPRLPGREPLGGPILSHDFVEAALMCRAGHGIHLLAELGGSFEESPPTLIDHVKRDRRWCQGNLQHSRVLGWPQLRTMSRAHMVMGIMAYASAPLWLVLMLTWTAHAVATHFTPHDYFAPDSLFPVFEVPIATQAITLLTVSLLLLFVPRILAVLSRLIDGRQRRAFGGGRKLLTGFVAECLLSTLAAPALMLEHTRAVVGVLSGRSTAWHAQRRGESGSRWRESLVHFGPATALGVAWAGVLWWTSPPTLAWMVPLLVGLMLAVPIAVATGSPAVGAWLRRRGWLLTPGEVSPEPVVERFRALLASGHRWKSQHDASALERVLADPELRRLHLANCNEAWPEDAIAAHALEGLVLECKLRGVSAMSDTEQRHLLASAPALQALAEAGLR